MLLSKTDGGRASHFREPRHAQRIYLLPEPGVRALSFSQEPEFGGLSRARMELNVSRLMLGVRHETSLHLVGVDCD